MQKEKILLQSPEPLEDEGKKLSIIYLIASFIAVCGLIFGLCCGSLLLAVIFGVLPLLIGWGIKNSILKQKCWELRNIRFLLDEKPPYNELYQRLLPVFNQLHIETKVLQNGTISILYNGLTYDIRYNSDDSFSIWWSQSMAQAILRQGYYISIYKKIRVGMGLIAYYVQRACLTQQYPTSDVQEATNDNVTTITMPQKKKM